MTPREQAAAARAVLHRLGVCDCATCVEIVETAIRRAVEAEREAEREACAKLVDEQLCVSVNGHQAGAIIRASGNSKEAT